MKICPHHEAAMLQALWKEGLSPSSDPKAPVGPLPFTRLQLMRFIASVYPVSAISAPADACPFCHGVSESLISAAAKATAEAAKHGHFTAH